MIIVEKAIQNKMVVINADMIEFIEEIPETVITLTTGKKIIVKEKKEEIIELVVNYRRAVYK
jgi:flagellar protein FlbD